MRSIFSAAAVITAILHTLPIQAANPEGLIWLDRGQTTEGVAYENFQVRCSDETLRPGTHYKRHRGWCTANSPDSQCLRTKAQMLRRACKEEFAPSADTETHLAGRGTEQSGIDLDNPQSP